MFAMTRLAAMKDSVLARNAAWAMSGQVLSLASQAAYFILLARLLGSTEYGIFVGATALVAVVSTFSSMGSGMVLLRYVSVNPERFAEYWGNAVLSTFFSGLLIASLVTLGGPYLLHAKASGMLLMIAIGDCLFAKFADCAGQAFQAFERLRITATLNVLTSLLRLTAVVALSASLGHATAALWAAISLCVSAVASIFAVAMVSINLGLPRFRPGLLRDRLAEGFGFSVASSTTSLYNDVDKAMLSRYGMYASSGTYSVAYRIIDFACVPIRSLHAAAMPRFFRARMGAIQSNAIFAKRILKRTFPYGVLAGTGLFAVAPLVPMLLGDGFAASVPALRWLCLIPALRTLHISAGDAITGAGHQRLRTCAQFGAAGLNVGLNLYFIPRWSWLGAAWSSLLTDGALAAANWVLLTLLLRSPQQSAVAAQEAAA
jgi:O-antigen/teichoic acid export membrane protein